MQHWPACSWLHVANLAPASLIARCLPPCGRGTCWAATGLQDSTSSQRRASAGNPPLCTSSSDPFNTLFPSGAASAAPHGTGTVCVEGPLLACLWGLPHYVYAATANLNQALSSCRILPGPSSPDGHLLMLPRPPSGRLHLALPTEGCHRLVIKTP